MKIQFLLVFLLASPGFSQTYYVSPSGSDTTGDGSTGNRFATAWFAAFTARSSGVKSIKLASGNYYNTLVSLTNAADSGLTIEADTGATPILYGGQPITGWTTNGANQEATLPAFPSYTNYVVDLGYVGAKIASFWYITNRLISDWNIRDVTVDNIRIPQSRLPEYTNWFHCIPSNTSRFIFNYTGTDVPSATVVTNAEIFVYWEWQASKVLMTNLDTVLKTVIVDPGVARNFGDQGWSNYAVFNTAEGLSNGVWYHDKANNKLIIKTNSLVGKTVVAGTRSSVINLIGVSDITLRGLTVRNTDHPTTIDSQGGTQMNAAIDGWNCTNCTVVGCTVDNVAATGIRLGVPGIQSGNPSLETALNSTIVSNIVNNAGNAGIAFQNGTVSYNNVTNYGEIFWMGGAIVHSGNNSLISYNNVDNGAWSGISSYTGKSNTIIFNTVRNTTRLLFESCGIYVGVCSNNFIGFNQVFGRSDHSWNIGSGGVCVDGVGHFTTIVSNLVVDFHLPISFSGATNCFASNNICVVTGDFTFQLASDVSNGVATHNIFDYTGVYIERNTLHSIELTNNYFYSPLGPIGLPAAMGSIFTGRMIDSQYRLVHSSQLISPRINPLVGLVPDTSSSAGLVKVGVIRKP